MRFRVEALRFVSGVRHSDQRFDAHHTVTIEGRITHPKYRKECFDKSPFRRVKSHFKISGFPLTNAEIRGWGTPTCFRSSTFGAKVECTSCRFHLRSFIMLTTSRSDRSILLRKLHMGTIRLCKPFFSIRGFEAMSSLDAPIEWKYLSLGRRVSSGLAKSKSGEKQPQISPDRQDNSY
ncbi:hypothetical protein RJ639_004033 [Escallonia herrerae]|uniref:Uncharacterized protein n=1 Tax=Escallonia herrerae TaxID=1293975 RepID=A0AA89AXX8_9ASTE|nr:hypothetical protein RJ639_004033 [Escallonia herrerae]